MTNFLILWATLSVPAAATLCAFMRFGSGGETGGEVVPPPPSSSHRCKGCSCNLNDLEGG